MDRFDEKSGDLLRIGMFSEKITVLCEDNFKDKRDPPPRVPPRAPPCEDNFRDKRDPDPRGTIGGT